MRSKKKYLYKNWAGNVSNIVDNYFQPENEEELISIIKNSNRIKVIGTAHSWSSIHQTQDTILNLDLYNKILYVDKENCLAKVQAGIKLWQLNEYLDQQGLALKNLGSIDQQSIAGAISTGTHGTGITFQVLASQVVEFSMIKADGEKIILNKEKDKALFDATIISLGALGIISEITLHVRQAFNLHEYTTTYPFDDMIENLDQLLAANQHFKMWWLPPTDDIVVFKFNSTEKPTNDSKIRQYLQDKILSVYIYRIVVIIAKFFPKLAKFFNKLLTKNMKGPIDRIEKSYKVHIVPEPPKHRETEWTFDLSNAKNVLKAYKKFITENQYNLNFIQEIRFTKADDFWLSACYKRDALWLGLYGYEHENWDNALEQYENFAKSHNGRPHWGKEFYRDKNYIKNQYEKYDDFVKLKLEFDPNNKFYNQYLKEIFE